MPDSAKPLQAAPLSEIERLQELLAASESARLDAEAARDRLAASHGRQDVQGRLGGPLIEHLPGGVAYLDKDFHFQVVNPAYCRFIGKPPEELVGRHVHDALPGAREFVGPIYDGARASMQPVSGHAVPVAFTDGDLVRETYWDFTVNPLADAAGAFDGWLTLCFEVSDRVRLAREMAEQKALTEQIINDAPTAMAYLDRDLTYQWVNPAHLQLLGLVGTDILGRSLDDVFGAEAVAEVGPTLRNVLETRQSFHATGFPFTYAQAGRPVSSYWDMHCAPVFGTDGQVQGVLLLANEVSARVKSELSQNEQIAKLQDADRMKDQFLSVISHELRTPLNFITGFASTLEDEVHGPMNAAQLKAVGRIINGADRMLLLVDDLLDFAKLQAGKFELTPVPTPFGPLVDEAVALMRALSEPKGITIEVDVQVPGTPALDGSRITQVLTNLLSNALKFTPRGGRVRVTAALEAGRLVTEVSDTGCGIAPENLPKLFQRFQQLDMGNRRQAGGTGLGLAISKALVEVHGGTIEVESTPDVGTTFRFSLPYVALQGPQRLL